VTLAQAKKQLEIAETDSTHDEHLTLLIQAAREQFESDTGIVLGQRTVKVFDDEFEEAELQLQLRPAQSITSIKYYDSNNTQQTLSTSIYDFDTAKRSIVLKYNQLFPPVVIQRYDAVEITYVVGYATQAAIPAVAKQACLLLIGNYFEGRDMLKESDAKTYERLVTLCMRSTYP
jgi:uncharacterized phiE125 gp8 family phage protein